MAKVRVILRRMRSFLYWEYSCIAASKAEACDSLWQASTEPKLHNCSVATRSIVPMIPIMYSWYSINPTKSTAYFGKKRIRYCKCLSQCLVAVCNNCRPSSCKEFGFMDIRCFRVRLHFMFPRSHVKSNSPPLLNMHFDIVWRLGAKNGPTRKLISNLVPHAIGGYFNTGWRGKGLFH